MISSISYNSADYFRLYPDCKLVHGLHKSAIYDLTRNSIYTIPSEIAKVFEHDYIRISRIPERLKDEFLQFVMDNELGRINMTDEFKQISEEFIFPGLITNAILDISNFSNDIQYIANELNEVGCTAVLLRFVDDTSSKRITEIASYFRNDTVDSLTIALKSNRNIEEIINALIWELVLCSGIIVFETDQEKDIFVNAVPISYRRGKLGNMTCSDIDCSQWTNANLFFYNESLKYNNCLNRKVYIDVDGNVCNCPIHTETFGNVYTNSLGTIVKSNAFQEKWIIADEFLVDCKSCELRYACTNCKHRIGQCVYKLNRGCDLIVQNS